MKKNYKYVHILYHYDTIFTVRIVQMINDPKNGFNINEHLFVTPYLQVYERIKNYPNVVLHQEAVKRKSSPKRKSVKVLLDYADKCDWIFLHSLCRWTQTLLIKRKYRKKIIWRTYGHDLCARPTPNSFKEAIKWVIYPLFVRVVKSFKAIGGDNIVDELVAKERFGDLITMQLPYVVAPKINFEKQIEQRSYEFRVMIGHSGDPVDQHLRIAHLLERWKDKNIRIFCPVAYGDSNYINMIKHELTLMYGSKISFVTEMMDYSDYRSFISTMDAVILPGRHSYALDNVGLALFYRKKIFLSKDGIICKAFNHDNLPYETVEKIEKMGFLDFIEPVQYPSKIESTMLPISYEDGVRQWHRVLNWLMDDGGFKNFTQYINSLGDKM